MAMQLLSLPGVQAFLWVIAITAVTILLSQWLSPPRRSDGVRELVKRQRPHYLKARSRRQVFTSSLLND